MLPPWPIAVWSIRTLISLGTREEPLGQVGIRPAAQMQPRLAMCLLVRQISPAKGLCLGPPPLLAAWPYSCVKC